MADLELLRHVEWAGGVVDKLVAMRAEHARVTAALLDQGQGPLAQFELKAIRVYDAAIRAARDELAAMRQEASGG